MAKLKPDKWVPVGVKDLETDADVAVRSKTSTLVVAGPGAGKTELLAQRACFLLQTNQCKQPKRILAISFKRDAARNLQNRVQERCGSVLAHRFDSMTFDAFAKGLVDRFRLAIPEQFRPSSDYKIEFGLTDSKIGDWLRAVPTGAGGLKDAELATINMQIAYWKYFVGQSLSTMPPQPINISDRATRALWAFLLHNGKQSTLNFHMIGRLAELILTENPKVLRALRATYGYVFLDEFQDTTEIQYQLTRTAFLGSESILSAVGDNKQRIMTWAGALDKVFVSYEHDFEASIIRLKNNYRSAPELVRIQNYLIQELDKNAVAPVAIDDGTSGNGECRVLLFEDHTAEARFLSEQIETWINQECLEARDICILTRNRPGDYTDVLRSELNKLNIEARIESELQDILSEPIAILVIHILRIVTQRQAPSSRSAVLDLLVEFAGGDAAVVEQVVEKRLLNFASGLRGKTETSDRTPEFILEIVKEISQFFDRAHLEHAYPQYSQGSLFDDTIAKLATTLSDYLQIADWPTALDSVEGFGSVPIMTMHKSKGLEYHTVIFVGLEDSALWNFSSRQSEEICGFFVAFSRAKKRVLFTFCDSRPRYAGRRAEAQNRQSIGRLYDLLQSAGVTPEEIIFEDAENEADEI